jgi:hypothetical protein
VVVKLSLVVVVSWLSLSSKTEMDFLDLSAGFQPSKSGRAISASSRESSDSKYASLLALLGLLRSFGAEKNLLLSGGESMGSASLSSHRRAFLGGLFIGSVEGAADELDVVPTEDVRLVVGGLPAIRASILEIGSVRRRLSRGDDRVRLEGPGAVGRVASSR